MEQEKPIIPLCPKTDFDKLLFALKYIDFLKAENSKLKTDYEELKEQTHNLMRESADARKLDGYKKELKDLRAKVKQLQRG